MTQLVLGAKPMALENMGAADNDDGGVIDYGNINNDLMVGKAGRDNKTVIKSLFSNYKHAPEDSGTLSGRQKLLEPNQRSNLTVLSKQQEEVEHRKTINHWQPPSLAAGPQRPEAFAS